MIFCERELLFQSCGVGIHNLRSHDLAFELLVYPHLAAEMFNYKHILSPDLSDNAGRLPKSDRKIISISSRDQQKTMYAAGRVYKNTF